MVFTTTNLFKGIQCPYANQCKLTNCIFAHDVASHQSGESQGISNAESQPNGPRSSISPGEPATKRRKVTYDNPADKPPSKADQIRSQLAESRKSSSENSKLDLIGVESSKDDLSQKPPPSLARSVSPPLASNKSTSRSSQDGTNNRRPDNEGLNNGRVALSKPELEPKESLNPRLIPNDPAGHAKRSLLLKYLHSELVRLNKTVSDGQNMEDRDSLTLNSQQLIHMALEEEEKLARDQPKVYSNVMKQRIALYKKMTPEIWKKQVNSRLETEQPKHNKTKPLNTGLTAEEELVILPYLVANQTGLENFGYVTTPPTEAEAAEASAAVEASHNFEICDRCSSRFQVFPDRNDDGLLTSNGPCWHHPNKKVFPSKTKGDVVSGFSKEPYYPCCGNIVGSPGCTSGEFHVFKTSSPARLAAILSFITTPDNDNPARDRNGKEVEAVTFDCEMGYTTSGLELIRLTAVSWPSNEELIDTLVRPLGTIIDLNSRFSGVWPESFSNAIPYVEYQKNLANGSTTNGDSSTPRLPVVDSPQKARELLCSFLAPGTPLIGHAIDNDLNTVRLCHPSIVDTVLLYPHPRGLPIRNGLKALTSIHLGRSIQMGGDRGHDSLEDAQATGDLVRFKIGERWKVLQSQGWRINDKQLVGEGLGGTWEEKAQAVLGRDTKVSNVEMAKRKGKRTERSQRWSNGSGIADGESSPTNGVAGYMQYANQPADGGDPKL